MIFFIGMRRVTEFIKAFFAVMTILVMLPFNNLALAADPPPENEVTRTTTITVPTTEYIWWVTPWSGNLPVCTVTVDHEGLPTHAEIYDDCGKAIYTQWSTTPACTLSDEKGNDPRQCPGFYLHLVNNAPSEKTVEVELPLAEAKISVVDCNNVTSSNRCSQIPSLLVTGYEPLPNQQITTVHVNLNGQEYNCPGSTCKVPLSPTTLSGVPVEFWVDSSYGDSSPHFTALVRVVDTGVSSTPGGAGWIVDIISPQCRRETHCQLRTNLGCISSH